MPRSAVTVEPTTEPVELIDVKLHLGINDSTFDTYLETLITSGRVFVEQYLSRKLITQTIDMYLDEVELLSGRGAPIWEGRVRGSQRMLNRNDEFDLDFLPVQSVTEITYFSEDDTETVWATTNYRVSNVDPDIWARVALRQGGVWPTNTRAQDAIKVTYVAGYGDAKEDVPGIIRQAILLVVAYMFENRGDCPTGTQLIEAAGVADILNTYKVYSGL